MLPCGLAPLFAFCFRRRGGWDAPCTLMTTHLIVASACKPITHLAVLAPLLQTAAAMADMALWESGGFSLHGGGQNDEESSEEEE